MKVLVIEDDKFTLNMAVKMFEGRGLTDVATATEGARALAEIDNSDGFDAIFCDLNMPRMDGVELLRHLAERKCEAAIVLVSGEDERLLKSAEDLAAAHQLNVLGSIQKPITPLKLQAMLDKVGSAVRKSVERPPMESISEQELRSRMGDAVVPFFQPKVDTRTREVLGVESLVRWRSPEGKIISPAAFVPIAEECGLIDEMTDGMIERSMDAAGHWREQGVNIKVSVNISVVSLCRLHLPEYIVSCSEKTAFPHTQFMLEVTESRLMEDVAGPLEILTRLRMKDIGVSIDDFGTGYSSMQQLKRIPFSELKIDRAFVHGAARDTSARAILESSVELAKKLEISTVAEGVEDDEDWNLVAEVGCDMVQGYGVSRPMPGDELVAWHSAWSS
ncbi:MAG: EAL domain-containing response regulator [Gammaproteobacteria bacterium]